MADLRQALQPSAPASPLPVAEIAARADRRRRRRLVQTSVFTAAALAGAVLVVTSLTVTADDRLATDGSLAAVADGSPAPHGVAITSTAGPDPGIDVVTTAGGASGSTEIDPGVSRPGPSNSEPPPVTTTGPATTSAVAPAQRSDRSVTVAAVAAGIGITTKTTSSWPGGFCLQVDLANTTDRPIAWQVTLDLPGTIDTIWSAVPQPAGDGSVTFRGEAGYNESLAGQAATTFGMCLATEG